MRLSAILLLEHAVHPEFKEEEVKNFLIFDSLVEANLNLNEFSASVQKKAIQIKTLLII